MASGAWSAVVVERPSIPICPHRPSVSDAGQRLQSVLHLPPGTHSPVDRRHSRQPAVDHWTSLPWPSSHGRTDPTLSHAAVAHCQRGTKGADNDAPKQSPTDELPTSLLHSSVDVFTPVIVRAVTVSSSLQDSAGSGPGWTRRKCPATGRYQFFQQFPRWLSG